MNCQSKRERRTEKHKQKVVTFKKLSFKCKFNIKDLK